MAISSCSGEPAGGLPGDLAGEGTRDGETSGASGWM